MASRSWNRVELIGNLTRDPELRYTPTGTAVATFSIATNRTYISDGERKEEADFHRIVAWSKLAELCSQLLKKGNRVFVSGRLQNRSWEGQDGQSRQTTEIVIEDMILLTSRTNGPYAESVPEGVTTPLKTQSVVSEVEGEVPSDAPNSAEAAAKGEKAMEGKEAEEKDEKESNKKSAKVETEDVGDLDDLPF